MVIKKISSIEKKNFLNITKNKYYHAVEHAQPMFAWFSLTEDCNLACRFCFTDARLCSKKNESAKKKLNKDLTTEQIFQILDNVSKAGTTAIQFAGGEPLLRPDLADIISYAVQKNIYVALNTNGTLINDREASVLAGAGLSQVKVSIDGLKKNHEWNRGENTFDKAVNALRLFRSYGIGSVYLIMTLSSVNFDDLVPLLDLTKELQVQFIMVEFLPVGHSIGKHKWSLSIEQRREAQHILWEEQKKRGLDKIQFENRYIISEQELTKKMLADPDRPSDFFNFGVGCISGIYSYMITAGGRVATGCLINQEVENSNLLKRSLTEIWTEGKLFKKLRNRENLKGTCGKCLYRYVCGGCRRSAFIQTGDFMQSDPNCWVKSEETNETTSKSDNS